MYEPFVNNLGTASLLEHLERARRSIEKFNDVSNPEREAIDLLEQLKDLIAVTTSIDDLATRERRTSSTRLKRLSAADLVHLQSVYDNTAIITQECVEFIEPLRPRLEDIIGFATADSRLGAQSWYNEIYLGLKLRTEVLRVLFSGINLLLLKNDTDEDGQLSPEGRSFASTLQYQIALVKPKLNHVQNYNTTLVCPNLYHAWRTVANKPELQNAVAAATGVTLHVPVSLNRHYIVGQSAKSFYTGRERQMVTLKTAFEDSRYAGQKKFVIYGLGGSGKTELALKYAEENMQNYWGVFFVDGSSRKNASASYSEIAKVGGVEPNEKAAKNWLTTRALPWLLIVDNADDDEIRLEELLPAGTRGCVLVTSRNPAHKSYGTVGERYLELLPMEVEEANELILRAADEPSPWTKAVKDPASVICQALGFLPLALVHAGKAILLGVCSWHEYLGHYERQVREIRRERSHRRDRSLSRSQQISEEDKRNQNVFGSYEILYHSLSSSQEQRFQDAVELLHVFSYLHFQNIRLDILINAGTNPLKEAKQREKETRENMEIQKRIARPKRKTWSKWFREQAIRLAQYLATNPPLPDILKNLDGLGESSFEDEIHVRLGMALSVLVSRSLITKQDRLERRYCMHPLVHKWVRERPEMSASQQALWCQVTSTILSRDVLFPPLGDSETERSMRRELLPHIIHVRGCQQVIRDRLKENRADRKRYLSAIEPNFGSLQAIEAARFSRVYSECGLFSEAFQLQSRVRNFVIQKLGEDHVLSIQITLLLTGTLFELTRTLEATQLQRRLYEVCVDSLGQDHPLTLKVADILGSVLCFHGRWSESFALHQRSVEGMKRVLGEDHEDTFKAILNLARVYLRTMEFEKSAELHQLAWEGLKKQLGELHVDTIACLEDLSMCRLRLGESYLADCYEKMTFIFEHRRKTLGKEQPYTLLSICNLGRVKSAMGQHDEAAKIMREALTIAERNLGEDHFGVLSGKTHYAQVLVRCGRCEEAEEMFYTVVEKPQYRKSTDEDGEHPDRLIALWYLIGCLEKQEKFQKALEVCEGMIESLKEIGGNGLGTQHKFAAMVQKELDKLKVKIHDNVKGPRRQDSNIPGEL
jgi:tetratricopeptide (TPR) repeat protein